MKTIACLLLFVIACQGFEDQCQGPYLRKVFEKCVAENGGDMVVVEDLLTGKESRDENGKCFRACLYKECNYIDENNILKADVPARLAHILHGGDETKVKQIEEAATKCVAVHKYEKNFCHTIENLTKCIGTQCSKCGLKLFNVYEDSELPYPPYTN